ncbi:MAG: hypothetical protein IJP74_05000 [Prevotella sp.]|nr:hypothetical protein [Prevotella sp.]
MAKKMKRKNSFFGTLLIAVSASLIVGCKNTAAPTDSEVTPRGEPTLVCDTIVFDEASKTFNLSLHADSTADAKVTFFLLDGDSILMQNTDGQFSGIPPFEEGYNVRLQAEWSDTTITTPLTHIVGFVVPREPVDKIPADELQKLINSQDKSLILGNNLHLAQGLSVVVTDTQMEASSLQDVITLLKNGVWKSVTVTDVSYDDNNLITAIKLKPVGEQQIEDEDYDEDF